ncbi:MAG: hypothetical protein AAF211_26315, partial [Myxococcota bacterium]
MHSRPRNTNTTLQPLVGCRAIGDRSTADPVTNGVVRVLRLPGRGEWRSGSDRRGVHPGVVMRDLDCWEALADPDRSEEEIVEWLERLA